MESILNIMGALLPPPKGTRTLNWHYRSEDERLIAFSNAQQYVGRWFLWPASLSVLLKRDRRGDSRSAGQGAGRGRGFHDASLLDGRSGRTRALP